MSKSGIPINLLVTTSLEINMADKPVKIREDIEDIDIDNDNEEEKVVAPVEEKRPPRKTGGQRSAGPPQRGGNRAGPDGDGGRGGGFNKRGGYFQGRRRVCPIKIEEVDWKNLDSLRYFVSDDGSIRPRRKTGANAKLQRKVAVMVKRARHMALLPYTGEHVRISGTGRR
jgi:small subunit ribosomal protein S18